MMEKEVEDKRVYRDVGCFRILWCRIFHGPHVFEVDYRSGSTINCNKCFVEHYIDNIWL